jgi:hypothetical protein
MTILTFFIIYAPHRPKKITIFAAFFNRCDMGKRTETIIIFVLILIMNLIIGLSFNTSDPAGSKQACQNTPVSPQAQFESPQDPLTKTIEYLLLQKNSNQPVQTVSIPHPDTYNTKSTLYTTTSPLITIDLSPSYTTGKAHYPPYAARRHSCNYIYLLEHIII